MGVYICHCDSNVKLLADADLRGIFFPEEAMDDTDTAGDCLGFVVSYLGYPVIWKL